MAGSIIDRVIDSLKARGLADGKKLDELAERISRKGETLSVRTLSESGVVPEHDILKVLSSELGIPPIDVSRVALDEKVLKIVPEKLVRRHSVLPVARIGNNITLVTFDPTDVLAMDDIKTVTGCDIDLLLATKRDIENAIRTFYDTEDRDLSGIMDEDDPEADLEIILRGGVANTSEMAKESATAPIVKMVSVIINEAIKKRASDIHIEPQEKNLRIRYRVDGELQEAFTLPKKNQNAVLTRLKIMSNLDITENRIPQDGRFRVRVDSKDIDFRVSSLPLVYGNKMVLRALDRSNLSVGLDSLGFLPGPLQDFKTALAKPFGIILVTGPTGSGKSTTLYSVLNEMNVPERNIVTVEDPVEYQVAGITQIAARPDIGLDFASGLRAILRQSPDTIMVGEIRDFETADIAIKASLTGQMVLSTLHTNDSVGAITRLINMGVEPFLVSTSLVMACAQRLLKRICPNCKEEYELSPVILKKLCEEYPEAADTKKFYTGKGCAQCGGTGYRGRLGTLETLLIDDKIKDMIVRQCSELEIREYLKEKGVKTLRDNAMMKFLTGWTTLEEVYRVT
ncbi:MAG: GspE/PulE family protein [Candidatus Omnitrophota bacterium]